MTGFEPIFLGFWVKSFKTVLPVHNQYSKKLSCHFLSPRASGGLISLNLRIMNLVLYHCATVRNKFSKKPFCHFLSPTTISWIWTLVLIILVECSTTALPGAYLCILQLIQGFLQVLWLGHANCLLGLRFLRPRLKNFFSLSVALRYNKLSST